MKDGSEIQQWILSRNGFEDVGALRGFLSGRQRILDAGCGNGRVTALLRSLCDDDAEVIGVDYSSAEVARANLAHLERVFVFAADLTQDLSDLGRFDFIYCQEVLHHTENPFLAFSNLAELLSHGGEIAIYVYKKKAPGREFMDEFVRSQISVLDYQEAMQACREITALGMALSQLGTTVAVPSVGVMGIEEGSYDIQRFIYHFFAKCFWNSELTPEENALVNFDWYHPETASRHSIDEVLTWFKQCSLEVVHVHVDHYGITVRGRRSMGEAGDHSQIAGRAHCQKP